jgi:preprotein translocase subunit SecE
VSDTTTGAAARPERRPARPAERQNAFQRIGLWWRQIVAELRKVIWPNRKQMITYTSVVLAFLVFMVTLIGLVDLGLAKLVLQVFG